MVYTEERLRSALLVYKAAQRQELESGFARQPPQRHLRNDYNFRQMSNIPTIASTFCGGEPDSSADEYCPVASKKRRSTTHNGMKSTKRAKLAGTCTDNATRSSPISLGENDMILATLVTLKLPPQGKVLLGALAEEYGSGYNDNPETLPLYRWKRTNKLLGVSSVTIPKSEDSDESTDKTYLQNKDEESGAVERRTNRSGLKRLENGASAQSQRCTACKKAKRRCSLKTNSSKPCTRCYTEGLDCVTSIALPPVEPMPVSPLETTSIAPLPVEITPISPLETTSIAPPRAETTPITPVEARSNTKKAPGLLPILPAPFQIAETVIVRPFRPTPSQREETKTPAQKIREYAAATRHPTFTALVGFSKDHPIMLDSPPSSPEPALDSTYSKISPVFMDTFFAHPIDFKHIPTPETPCHFCRDFRYGIYGYGQLTVELASYPGETQLVECGNGWISKGREPTRMCVTCSLKRLYISRCKVHVVRRVTMQHKGLFDQYVEQLVEPGWEKQGAPALKEGVYPSCALCPQPGLWRCFADQRFDRVGRKLCDGKGRGCGLVLCESCAFHVKVDGVLRKNIVKTSAENTDLGPRADMEFLFPGSLLHKAFATKSTSNNKTQG